MPQDTARIPINDDDVKRRRFQGGLYVFLMMGTRRNRWWLDRILTVRRRAMRRRRRAAKNTANTSAVVWMQGLNPFRKGSPEQVVFALVVFQLNCTWSLARNHRRSRVQLCRRRGHGRGWRLFGRRQRRSLLFLQPDTAVKATSKSAIEKTAFCVFKGILLLKKR